MYSTKDNTQYCDWCKEKVIYGGTSDGPYLTCDNCKE